MVCELLLVSLVLSLPGQFAFASSAGAGADGPEVVMASTKRDFGDVFAGEELEQNFPVRNTGNKPLELSQKSTLGSRSTAPRSPVRTAVWRPNEPILPRPASANPAAPS